MSTLNSDFRISKAVVDHTAEHELLASFFHLNSEKPGVFIDIGGNLPTNAVSRPFLESDWTGIVVEPIPANAELFRICGWPIVEEVALTSPSKAETQFGLLHLGGGDDGPHSSLKLEEMDPRSRNNREIRVQLNTLQELLDKHEIKHITLLSIDTEGTELDVLTGIDFNKISVDLILIEDWQRDATIHSHLIKKGFKIVLRSGFNSWYVPKSSNLNPPLLGYLKLLKKIYVSSYIKKFRHAYNLGMKTPKNS